ncbi:methylated-DNA--[protein]-cysteine S-methyltransferase [Leptonema illini]|uniref:Methylated-DNA--protein-cysteine methyltransferase n=1 Tax=Leptonema illini DSM 21528 TaxID=929563 RepID=H2CIU9_9LEPT|nr:methylated-DNA--[protein]-cysteine S-methyltransferase [Leptonema illini]EHQ08116.1 methylated-DNA/protein-cysteinemethyltransferase [Leptonema illini DSM 21528]
MLHATVSSPVGPLHIDIEDDAVIRLDFDDLEMSDFFTDNALYSLLALPESANEERLLAQTVVELAEYFQGERQDFGVPVRLYGTEFRRRTWQRLEAIPFGVVKSYGDIANELGQPKASRAVGGACGSNPVAIIVPCHRVAGSTGKLTGFGGGLKRKDFLLKLESKQLPFQRERYGFARQRRDVEKNRHPTR